MKMYGCYDRSTLAENLLVQDGWIWKYREPKLKTIKVEMTKDCQYTKTALGIKDDKCKGCIHQSEVAAKNLGSVRKRRRAKAVPEVDLTSQHRYDSATPTMKRP